MRILHAMPVYAPAWQYGGPVLSVSRLCEALAGKGIAVEVITTNAGLSEFPASQLGRPIMRNGVPVTYYPVDRPTGPIRSRGLEEALSGVMGRADLLHLSAIWQPLGIPIQREAIQQGVPILHTLRGALGPYSLGQRWWKKLPYFLVRERPYLQQAAGLHVTSEQEANELWPLALRAPRWFLPNPMDLDQLHPNPGLRQQWRRQLGVHSNHPLLLICGRQHHKKGLDLLPPVLSALRDKPWQLLLLGGDEDGSGQQLIQQLQRRGLGQRVIEHPTVPAAELGGVYNAADLLLLPSRHENFGNVVPEALACGCAVAISDRTGVGVDLQRSAPQGFGTVLPRRCRDWIQWLGWWLEDAPRASLPVSQWVAQHYSQSAVADRAIELYQQILQTQQG